MPTVHLYDAGGQSWALYTGTGASPVNAGSRFTVSQFTTCSEIRWYRVNTVAGDKPETLFIWRASDQEQIAAATVQDTGTVGWQTCPLGEPVGIEAGQTYIVAAYWPSPARRALAAIGTKPTPPAPLEWSANARSYRDGGPVGFPNVNDNLTLEPVDVGVVGTGGSGGSGGTTTTDLNLWLSNDPTQNAHQPDGIPWETNERTKTISDDLGVVADQQNEWAFGLGGAAHGYYELIRGLIVTIKDNTDALPDFIGDLVDALADHLDSEIDGILGAIDDVLSGLGAQSTDLSGTAGSAVGALSGRTGFPATGWSMSAEQDFEDAIAFAEVADAYVLNITSYQDTQPANESPAGLWLPRLGWWCVLNGSLASQRQFVDFQQMLLTEQGRRMPGCAIQLRPGTLATVQAWLLA